VTSWGQRPRNTLDNSGVSQFGRRFVYMQRFHARTSKRFPIVFRPMRTPGFLVLTAKWTAMRWPPISSLPGTMARSSLPPPDVGILSAFNIGPSLSLAAFLTQILDHLAPVSSLASKDIHLPPLIGRIQTHSRPPRTFAFRPGRDDLILRARRSLLATTHH